MKKYQLHRNYKRFSILFYITFFVLPGFTLSHAQNSNDNSGHPIYNDKYFFSFNLPDDWNVIPVADSNSTLKFSAGSCDERQAIFVYVFESDGEIDLEKFALNDVNMFPEIGRITNTRREKKYLFFLDKIEKTYEANSMNAKTIFQVDDNLGYLLLWKSLDKDDASFLKVSKTFDVSKPILTTFIGWSKGLGLWIFGILGTLIGIGLLYLIGRTGQIFKKGIITKTTLIKVKKEMARNGQVVNEKWHTYNRRSTFWIVLPMIGWSIVYIFLFYSFPFKVFLISLLGLIPAILGYFGIFFVPSSDPDDYI